MLKTKLFLIATIGTVAPTALFTGMHYAAHSYVKLETSLMASVHAEKDRLLNALIASTGHSVPVQRESLTLPEIINQEATKQGIKPELIEALIEVESAWKPDAIRFEAHLLQGTGDQARMKASSHGLMQIMGFWAGKPPCPATTWSELYNPETNIICGTAILAHGLKQGSVYKALIEYNGGASCFKSEKCMAQAHHHATKVMTALAEKMTLAR